MASESGLGRSFEGVSSGGQEQQLCESSAQSLESTSPPYWDSDDDDDDGGSKPSDLYGTYTWTIADFSNKKQKVQLESDSFEAGGCKWKIGARPQQSHLVVSLSCLERDPPGWSHLVQFTIAVVNKDHKKSKYLDILWKFKKTKACYGDELMKTSELWDEFIVADTLIIKAEVQVIRGRVDRLFRCLDSQYRRRRVRVLLEQVEKTCSDFLEKCRDRFAELVKDDSRWSRFGLFWRNQKNELKKQISKENTHTIYEAIVKQFFDEENVTCTLVMDYLYKGLKALRGQNKKKKKRGKKSKAKAEETYAAYAPMVLIDNDSFTLSCHLLDLFTRVAEEGSTTQQNNDDSIESVERRLTNLGRRTIEVFVLSHILSKIDVLFLEDCALREKKIEDCALRKQNILIREELLQKKPKEKPPMVKNNRPKDPPLPNIHEEGFVEKTPPPYNREDKQNEKTPPPYNREEGQNDVLKQIHHMVIFNEVIGKGGSSTVYKGEFATRQVAIKKTTYKGKNPLKEVKNWAQADGHPNVVTYYGYECDEDENTLYIALELCTCTLEELIVGKNELGFDRSRMWENKQLLVDLISGILNGLKNLHNRGIIHRDLTPENILIKVSKTDDQWLCPKISDMGLIKDLAGKDGLEGSPEFLRHSENRKWKPPEQILTQKTDILLRTFSPRVRPTQRTKVQ